MEKEKILIVVALGGLAYFLFSQMTTDSSTTQTNIPIPQSVLIDNDPYLTPHFHTINF